MQANYETVVEELEARQFVDVDDANHIDISIIDDPASPKLCTDSTSFEGAAVQNLHTHICYTYVIPMSTPTPTLVSMHMS